MAIRPICSYPPGRKTDVRIGVVCVCVMSPLSDAALELLLDDMDDSDSEELAGYRVGPPSPVRADSDGAGPDAFSDLIFRPVGDGAIAPLITLNAHALVLDRPPPKRHKFDWHSVKSSSEELGSPTKHRIKKSR